MNVTSDNKPLILSLVAPLDGWVGPLHEVPDAVFAEKMMGDGLAIDPMNGELAAPCDGEVIVLHRALHAVTIRGANGAEILIHIGLETVALGGSGFTAHVAVGDWVKAGDRLISFDLNQVAMGAKSLITPILLTNEENYVIEQKNLDRKIARGQPLMVVRALTPPNVHQETVAAEIHRLVIVPMAHGIHARPAARLAELARAFKAELFYGAGERRANGRSAVALMGLGLAKGAEVTIIAKGSDAESAVAAIADLIESGMGEQDIETAPAVTMPAAAIEPGQIKGVRAAPGMALGTAIQFRLPDISVNEAGQGMAVEREALRRALAEVKQRLLSVSGAQAAIMAAHAAFLDDPELRDAAHHAISEGSSAGVAWRNAIRAQTSLLQGLKDPRFVERIADFEDLERQVLIALGGGQSEQLPVLPENAILLADDLLPSQLTGLDAKKLAGIATKRGGPTSHVAILAATMNIPALVACGPALLDIADGVTLLLDADQGCLTIDPAPDRITEATAKIQAKRRVRAAARECATELCHTKDGVRVEIAANLGSVADAEAAMTAGAEGCGLLRTEFLFLDRESPPPEEEQVEVYRNIAKTLQGRPLIVRTLDIGGDKPAPYLPIPAEENPALGLRGVRVSLWRPELLRTQLRAILRGVPANQCRIMIPMIANLSELRAVRALLREAQIALGINDKVSLGVMVETPAAAMTADILAREADFLSIGTNDLTQYALAMDRGNASVAAQIDALHPAVLRLIKATADGGALHGRWTGVCGGLASDLVGAPILVGLGVRELSVTAGQLPDIKARISALTLDQCRALAEIALQASSADEVRQSCSLAGEG